VIELSLGGTARIEPVGSDRRPQRGRIDRRDRGTRKRAVAAERDRAGGEQAVRMICCLDPGRVGIALEISGLRGRIPEKGELQIVGTAQRVEDLDRPDQVHRRAAHSAGSAIRRQVARGVGAGERGPVGARGGLTSVPGRMPMAAGWMRRGAWRRALEQVLCQIQTPATLAFSSFDRLPRFSPGKICRWSNGAAGSEWARSSAGGLGRKSGSRMSGGVAQSAPGLSRRDRPSRAARGVPAPRC
jgi:hypothetical protein